MQKQPRRKKREQPSTRRSWRITGKRVRRHEKKTGWVERGGEREGETHGSSERERQLAAFSRDDAPNRRAAAGSVSPVAAGRPASYLCPSLLFYVS